ncbi:MAG: tetratricopeptide repeat protein [Gomphosphaeria aponina SAG 52.96 = DSM 107014]|uniref:Tetratricopeptide repeat protein n=1 Tax=Gomphosphaeria aponina SAG 52.96 = DSM 107014 TaxID=1521640 RepID=A0A941GTN5_9CHRO|nr:tetratricopeptide repeat protein [Gomphosphaeria aponina SAG 52.96 = DSM 107014]
MREKQLKEVKAIKEKGELEKAIALYLDILKLNPENAQAHLELGEIYESTKQPGKAIAHYRSSCEIEAQNCVAQAKLGRLLLRQGEILEAVKCLEKALNESEKQPKWFKQWVSKLLIDAFKKNNQIDEIIPQYLEILKLNPECVEAHLELAEIYESTTKIEQAIAHYQIAINLEPNNNIVKTKLGTLLLLQGNIQAAVSYLQKGGGQSASEQEYFKKWINKFLEKPKVVVEGNSKLAHPDFQVMASQAWQALNQKNIEHISEQTFQNLRDVELDKLEKHFRDVSCYKNINLASLTEEDQQFIKQVGWSLDYISCNNNIQFLQQKVCKSNKYNEPKKIFQYFPIESKYMYSISPWTGKVNKTNCSLLCGRTAYYRFEDNQVFYLIVNGPPALIQLYLYFPEMEVIIHLHNNNYPTLDTLNMFKAQVIKNWQNFSEYIKDNNKVKTVAIIGYHENIGHHLWNVLSGLEKVFNYDILSEIDEFWVIGSEYFGEIDEIFPEISAQKIKRFTNREIFKANETILKNKYFAVILGHNRIQNNLAERVLKSSLAKISSVAMEEVEEAKRNFILFYVFIRTGNRTWVSQVEGTANIIQKLSETFYNLAVVFDGFSRPEKGWMSPQSEKTIEEEQEVVTNIQNLLPPTRKIYSLVGKYMHEGVVWADNIDFYLASWGAGLAKVAGVGNKPGVIHTNKEVLEQPLLSRCWWLRAEPESQVVPKYIDSCYITNASENVKKGHKFDKRLTLNNYDCDWRIIYEEVLKLALSIKRDD